MIFVDMFVSGFGGRVMASAILFILILIICLLFFNLNLIDSLLLSCIPFLIIMFYGITNYGWLIGLFVLIGGYMLFSAVKRLLDR
jgi:hypothetical protein